MIARLWRKHAPGHNHGNDIFLGTVPLPEMDYYPGFLVVTQTDFNTVTNFKHRSASDKPGDYDEMATNDPLGKNLIGVHVAKITPGQYPKPG